MTNDDLTLLLRHADGACDAAQTRRVNDMLRNDPEARAMLASLAMQAGAFADLAAEQNNRSVAGSAHAPAPVSAGRVRQTWMRPFAAAATVALIGTAAWLLLNPLRDRDDPPTLASVIQMTGTAQWSDGVRQVSLNEGRAVPGGVFFLDDDLDHCELLLDDGTIIWLRGPAELELRDDGQKLLWLRSGTLTADVKKQPEGRPMRIRTPASESVVLGTRFELMTTGEHTALAVKTGRVRIRHLHDDSALDVTSRQVAEIRSGQDNGISSRVMPDIETTWISDLSQPPAPSWRGDWLPAEDGLPPRLASVRRPVKRGGHEYRVSARNPVGPLAAISENSAVRLKYRLRRDVAAVEVFVSAQLPSGNYNGNYHTFIQPDDHPPGPDGWREVEVPFVSLTRHQPRFRPIQPDALLNFIYFSHPEPDAGLEVARIEILPAAGQ